MTSTLTPHAGNTDALSLDSRIWRCALTAGGLALVLLGSVAILAWACGEQDYLQLDSGRVPLHYNTAIGFLVWGVAYFAMFRNWNKLARSCAALLMLLGAVVVLLAILNSGIRLDRWAFTPSPFAPPHPPAGVSSGMGFGWFLGGFALTLALRKSSGPASAIVGTLVGLVLVIGAPINLWSGYYPNLLSRRSIAILGVLGAMFAGLPLLLSGSRRGVTSFFQTNTVSLAVGAFGIALTFTLWVALKAEQEERIRRQVQFETAHVQRIVLERLPEEARRLSEVAERWPDAKAVEPIPVRMKIDVGGYVGQMPGCLGVALIDKHQRVAWVESNGQPSVEFTDLGGGDALAEAVRTGQVALVRPLRSYWRGTRVLLIFAPHNAKVPGGLVSVIAVQQFYGNIINANVAAGYAVTVSESDDTVFVRSGTRSEAQNHWNQSLPLSFRGHEWRLSVWPTQDTLARESLSLPKLALLFGLLTTALLALAVYHAQTARRRTFALENEMRERKIAEQAMRQSEEKYRTLIENLGQGIFLQDEEHRYVAANAQFCWSIGRTEGEIIGATESDLFDRERAVKHSEEVSAVLANGRSVESETEVLLGNRRTQIRRVLTPVRNEIGRVTGVLGICWDVTEQRQLEAHVHQASKMDAIGQLAGGIAHDFNNLLTVILGNLEVMLADLAPNHPDHDLAVSAQSAAVRAASLTQRLLGFSRRHQLDWRPTNVNAVVTEVVSLLERTIDPRTRIRTSLATDLCTVQSDPTQLNQVLMNICLNARDAIGGPGQITIETACVTGFVSRIANGPDSRRDDFVQLRVTDTGAGMTPEVMARIYEPFFTTKDVGKGTGLGLAMVFAIVRQHKGWIDCASEVGVGTRFDIFLPRSEIPKLHDTAHHTPLACRTGQETILVVDDEELIRSLATTVLQTRGYAVLQAADGQQAIDLYAQEKDRIDLVILDLTMPVLSGHEAFRHLLSMNPRVKVLFVSGYSAEQLSDVENELMAGFIKKPYRPNELIQAVEASLSHHVGSRTGTSPAVLA